MKTMHILSNSHLDREHRHEFQETRLMMVEMLDDVIRIMETDDSYRYFTLDRAGHRPGRLFGDAAPYAAAGFRR